MNCLQKNTTEIRNIKQYLLTVLFNAPTTISNHYTSQVNHDMCNFSGYGIFDQPDGAAAGCDLAAGQGAEFEICDPGLGVWVNDVNIIWNEKKQDNGR